MEYKRGSTYYMSPEAPWDDNEDSYYSVYHDEKDEDDYYLLQWC